MNINQLAEKHGLAIARVGGEEDPYASLVQKTIGPPRLLKYIFAPSAFSVADDKLQEIVTKALSDVGISYVKTGNFASSEVYKLTRVIEDRVKPSPVFQQVMFDSSMMFLIANSGVDINAELKRVFLSKRVRAAIEKSKIKHLIDKEIEDQIGAQQ
jgi:hypothetical protein